MSGNKKNRRIQDRARHSATVIWEGSIIRGDLAGQDDFIVYGQIEGNADIDGAVMLQSTGEWRGNIVATHVVIEGHVEGDVHARERLEITASARVTGNISGHSVAIDEGAVIEGEIRMEAREGVSYFKEQRNHESQSDAQS